MCKCFSIDPEGCPEGMGSEDVRSFPGSGCSSVQRIIAELIPQTKSKGGLNEARVYLCDNDSRKHA
jgi:hypothetical protein